MHPFLPIIPPFSHFPILPFLLQIPTFATLSAPTNTSVAKKVPPVHVISVAKSMSCNGCRILRKGCNDHCILRQSLQAIDSPQAQANATVFVAKFFGRAGLMSFLSAVPESQRPALFQSLLYEACGRTVNPVTGVVGLLWTGNWHLCQSAAETVLRGGQLRPMMEFLHPGTKSQPHDYENRVMTSDFPAKMTGGRGKTRSVTPEEESETTTMDSRFESEYANFPKMESGGEDDAKLLRLFF